MQGPWQRPPTCRTTSRRRSKPPWACQAADRPCWPGRRPRCLVRAGPSPRWSLVPLGSPSPNVAAWPSPDFPKPRSSASPCASQTSTIRPPPSGWSRLPSRPRTTATLAATSPAGSTLPGTVVNNPRQRGANPAVIVGVAPTTVFGQAGSRAYLIVFDDMRACHLLSATHACRYTCIMYSPLP